MKKIVFSISILTTLVISSSSYAQKLMLGLRGGMDVGTVVWDSTANGINKSTINGLIGGAQLDIWFSNMVALSTGLLLDQKGWHEESNVPGYVASNDITLNYLEIPIFLKVGFSNGNFQPYVFAGPSIGYMFWGYAKQQGSGTLGADYKINDGVNMVDFSIVGGAGLTFNLSSGTQIFVDAGYAFGLVNILNLANPNYEGELLFSPSGTIKTRDVRIAGGMMFPI